jgi:hypothetical protein
MLGVVPIHGREPSTSSPAGTPDWRLRARVRLRRRTLDRELAAGKLPDDPVRLLRAAQLASRGERRRVAGVLAAILDAADERLADPDSALELDEMSVIAFRGELLDLIGLLRGTAPVGPQAVALARLLVSDRDSPLLRRSGAGQSVEDALSEIMGAPIEPSRR